MQLCIANSFALTQAESIENTPRLIEEGDGYVYLSWDIVTNASGYEVYYDTASVLNNPNPNVTYSQSSIVNDPIQNSIKIENLTNGTKYYFSVVPTYVGATTGDTYYSPELIATPQLKKEESIAFFALLSSKAENINTITLEFSRDITLPENPNVHFTITEVDNETSYLNIVDAKVGAKNNEVILTTEDQTEILYQVIVGLQVTDIEGNPIRTGITDRADFLGSTELNIATNTEPTKTEDLKESALDSSEISKLKEETTPEEVTPVVIKEEVVEEKDITEEANTKNAASQEDEAKIIQNTDTLPNTGFADYILVIIALIASGAIYKKDDLRKLL
jgi:hypothetical protein